jgi:lipoprotein-releasing system permease protein
VNLPLWIAARYLRTRRQNAFITLLTGISIGGVALGVTALLTVLAVMNGFENEIQTRIAGTDAHVVLLGEDTGGVADAATVTRRAAAVPGVAGVAPFTYSKAMVVHRGFSEGMVVKGVDLAAERGVTSVGANIRPPLDSIPTITPEGEPGIVLGSELAARIGAAAGDVVVLASLAGADAGATAGGFGFTPRLRPFRVVGIFTSGLYTYDSAFGFTSIAASQTFYELGDRVTGVEVRITDMFAAPAMGRAIVDSLRGAAEVAAARAALDSLGVTPPAMGSVRARAVLDSLGVSFQPPALRANNWVELNRNLFTWMKLEKAVMFLILALIVLVAAFNIVSTLFMVVLEKRRDIGVLKSLGATRAQVLGIFLAEGLLIGGLGTGLGTALGAGLIEVLRRYPLVRLPGDVYFIERLPVRPEAGDFAAVILAALVLCLAAAIYPAWRAACLEPVDAIRRQG